MEGFTMLVISINWASLREQHRARLSKYSDVFICQTIALGFAEGIFHEDVLLY